MSLPASIAPAILDTVLGYLARLFMTGALGDLTAALHAAGQMLAAYNVETEEELELAAEIISFGFHALEALNQAADPELSLNKVLRLRGSAVSLSRESHKSQRKLDKLQRDRRAGIPAQLAEVPPSALQAGTTPTGPQINEAINLIEFAREAIESATKNGGKTWTQSLQQRHTAKRIAAKLLKKQAQHASRTTRSDAAMSNATVPDTIGSNATVPDAMGPTAAPPVTMGSNAAVSDTIGPTAAVSDAMGSTAAPPVTMGSIAPISNTTAAIATAAAAKQATERAAQAA